MITYTRKNDNGEYAVIGGFGPIETEPPAVRILIDGDSASDSTYSVDEARAIVEKAINRGHAKAHQYRIVDANPPEPPKPEPKPEPSVKVTEIPGGGFNDAPVESPKPKAEKKGLDVAQILKLYGEGCNPNVIAKRIGASYMGVRNVLKREGKLKIE